MPSAVYSANSWFPEYISQATSTSVPDLCTSKVQTGTYLGPFRKGSVLRSVLQDVTVKVFFTQLRSGTSSTREPYVKIPCWNFPQKQYAKWIAFTSEWLSSSSGEGYHVFHNLPSLFFGVSQHHQHCYCQVNHDIIILLRLNPQLTEDNGKPPFLQAAHELT